MSETELWRRMAAHLPPGRLDTWADTVVLSELDGHTVVGAIAAGYDFKRIWRAVWGVLELPASEL